MSLEPQAIENNNPWYSYIEAKLREEIFKEGEQQMLWGSSRQYGKTYLQNSLIDLMRNEQINYNIASNHLSEQLLSELENYTYSDSEIPEDKYHYPF